MSHLLLPSEANQLQYMLENACRRQQVRQPSLRTAKRHHCHLCSRRFVDPRMHILRIIIKVVLLPRCLSVPWEHSSRRYAYAQIDKQWSEGKPCWSKLQVASTFMSWCLKWFAMICFLCHSHWTCQQCARGAPLLLPIWDTRAQVHHPLAKTVLRPAQHLLGINSSMPYEKEVMEKGYLGSGLLIEMVAAASNIQEYYGGWSWRACSLTRWTPDVDMQVLHQVTWWCPNDGPQFPLAVRP